MAHEAQRGAFLVSDDRAKIDLDAVHGVLTEIYWSVGVPKETVAKAAANSLVFGVYDTGMARPSGGGPRQVGFARVVSDFATFAYLCDVFVIEEYQGRGLSKFLMETLLAHPDLQGLRRFSLMTRNAHGLYERYGFKNAENPVMYMEKLDREIYRRKAKG